MLRNVGDKIKELNMQAIIGEPVLGTDLPVNADVGEIGKPLRNLMGNGTQCGQAESYSNLAQGRYC